MQAIVRPAGGSGYVARPQSRPPIQFMQSMPQPVLGSFWLSQPQPLSGPTTLNIVQSQVVGHPVSAPEPPECTVRLVGAAGEPSALSAVVVTLRGGQSYDPVFEKVRQEGVGGTSVATYVVSGSLRSLAKAFLNGGTATDPVLGKMLGDILQVDPAAVVFNWECCSACSCEGFAASGNSQIEIDLIHAAVQKGYMVMCSDFALKALISKWDVAKFGPNPFVNLGTCCGEMSLTFDSELVAACPSAQLKTAVELIGDGEAILHCQPETIVYGLAHGAIKATTAYSVDVLTVVTGVTSRTAPPHHQRQVDAGCSVAGRQGTAGHVLLRYPTGGCILASAGHWMELVKLDVSEDRLLEAAQREYGQQFSDQLQQQWAAAPTAEARYQVTQSVASQMVQSTVPCTYSVRG